MLSALSKNRPHRSVGHRPSASVQPVHTRIPGRARFKVAELYRSHELKHHLEYSLNGVDGIHRVQANSLTGSLLMVFDQQKPIEDIVRLISDRLEPTRSPAHEQGEEDGVRQDAPTMHPPIPQGQVAHLSTDALRFTALPAVILGSSPLVTLPISFVRTFSRGLFHTSPILILLTAAIVLMGQIIGRKEGWSRLDALYFSFVTASTIGYGDLRPTQRSTKLLSIVIGLVGLLLTGVLTAIGVNSAQKAFQRIP